MPQYQTRVETDVIVIGYGSAGGTSALTAARHGVQVLLLEKADQAGGNSLVSSAMMTYPILEEQKQQFVDYLHQVTHGTTPKELVQTFVDGLLLNPQWFRDLGGELEVYDYKQTDPSISYYIPDKTFPQLPAAKGLNLQLRRLKQTATVPERTGGARVWHLINRNVEKEKNIQVMTGTAVVEIVKNTMGQVIGVIADHAGERFFCKARKGVIMTCGGFEYDAELKAQYLRPQKIQASGSPHNTGDGVRLAEKVGAQLWHMDAEASAIGIKPDGWDAGFVLTVRRPGFIYVDSRGDRYVNEARLEAHNAGAAIGEFNLPAYEYSRLPSFLIMDEENGRGAPLGMDIFSYNVVVKGYQWSKDNSAEIAKGWIQVANDLPELSRITGIELTALTATISNYNAQARAGVDRDHGRPPETLKAIEAPYYVATIVPLMYNTQGGPRRDEHARVLDPDGKPIPHLFGAGECGSIWGFKYQTSTNFSETIVYGRIAGANAAQTPSVEDFRSTLLD
ncbi:FAD-dependent oxidoreductase [Duganella sp. FT135W]|uniref:FAD-dependent oxidoreductase n=1 Tax=Duganella flavida TaxID=2692175 RepID=A0A6L8K3V0_9BURK|nr:FAD-dependent oxidoreductase [Duganella flavida]MYM22183.1 FAD-dependent oxidoreductase [Duganella flavida]